MKLNKLSIVLFILSVFAIGAFAQNGILSPYSRYAYGIISDHATSMQRSMGGVGYAMNNGRQINAMNPASYAAIDTLTFLFDIGMDLSNVWQSETVDGVKSSDKNFTGGLDYVTMQFPLGRRLGASVGLIPYSSVGYTFGSEIDNGVDSRQGSGSLNEVYFGISGRVVDQLYIGAQISYLFGTIQNDTYAQISTSQYSLFEHLMTIRDYHLNFGLQYSIKMPKSSRLTIGATYSPAKTLLGTASVVKLLYTDSSTSSETLEEISLKNNYSLPETWGAGINYEFSRKLMIEADYSYMPWSKAKYHVLENVPKTFDFADRSKVAMGLQYTPDWRGSYFQRTQYRIGAYYVNDYIEMVSSTGSKNRLREYGVTAGFGLPIPQFKTVVNLGFEWKHRAANPEPLVKENYFNITIGVNFNEMWFRQSKIY